MTVGALAVRPFYHEFAWAVEYAAAYPGPPGRGLEDRIVAAASRRAR